MATGAVPGETQPKRFFFSFALEWKHADGSGFEELQSVVEGLSDEEPNGCGFAFLLPYEPTANDPQQFARVDACYVVDLQQQTAELRFSPEATQQRCKEFEATIKQLARVQTAHSLAPSRSNAATWLSDFEAADYMEIVAQIQEEIFAGRYYELNFTQRFRRSSPVAPRDVAAQILASPAKQAAYMATRGQSIISNSPELFLRVDGRRVITGPIKGTAPATEPLPFPVGGKDHAEHTMVLDMARNDLGCVCETGTVRVSNGYCIETHPNLVHLVSAIEGRLRPGVGLSELLQSTFPAASITGAPKVEVMRAIREKERSPRGLYTGATGWCGRDYLELNVAIRTLVAKEANDVWEYTVGSGGAIVAESNPQQEHDECMLKVRPLLMSI